MVDANSGSPSIAGSSSGALSGEVVAFTGTLASMRHRDAAAVTEQHGGRAAQTVSRLVTMLVVGEEGWPLEEDGGASEKLIHATTLISDGCDLRIITESEWLHLIGLAERRDEIKGAHTPAMLSRMLGIPVGLIRRWARIGLIRPLRRVFRLPYFDFREVAAIQRLSALLDQGVTAQRIESSLTQLSRSLTGTDRSLAQLNLLVQDSRVVMRDSRGVLMPRTGQRLLDFDAAESRADSSGSASESAVLRPFRPTEDTGQGKDPNGSNGLHTGEEAISADAADGRSQGKHPEISSPLYRHPEGSGAATWSESEDLPVLLSIVDARRRHKEGGMRDWSADEWYHEGCRLSEEAAFAAAINAFRNCLTLIASELALLRDEQAGNLTTTYFEGPDPADVNFHLADALYRAGRPEAAIERYHCAIEQAPDFVEAWTQLGCINFEVQRMQEAEDALMTAISIHAANPDALLQLAQLMDETDRDAEALQFWEEYLRHDSRGPWAEHARERLDAGDRCSDRNPASGRFSDPQLT